MKHDIEDIFKAKFEHFESEPSSGLFDQIQAKRSKTKKMAWIWSAAALLFMVSVATYLINDNRNVNLVNPDISTSQEQKNETSILQTNKLRENNETGLLPSKEETSLKPIPSDANEYVLSVTKSVDNVKKSKPAVSSNNNSKKIVNQKLANLFDELIQRNSIKKDGGILYQGNNKEHVEEAPILFESYQGSEEKSKSFKKEGEESEKIAQQVYNATRVNQTSDSAEKRLVEERATDTEEKDTLSIEEEATGPLPLHKLVKYSKWSIALSGGPGITGRILSGSSEYGSLRNNSETQRLGFSFNVRTIYELNANWNIQLGIDATERKEYFEHKMPNYTVETTRQEQRQEVVIHPVLGRIVREYTVDVTETTEIKGEVVSAKNRYLNVSIPVALERYLYRSDKISLVSKGEVMAGIYSKASGTQLTSNGELNSLNASPYRSIGIYQAGIGLGALFHLNKRITLIAYPQARISLNSSFSDQYELTQRETGLFGNVGLRIRL